jgi:ribosomal protein L37E
MGNYQVLFSGEVAEQASTEAVRNNLARELSIDERKARQLFSGRTVVIESHLSQQGATDLQARLGDLGAVCRIKDLAPKDNAAGYKIDRHVSDHTLRDITAAHAECPRCGHMQLESSHCARCGVDIAQAAKQRRKEDLLIEKKLRELRSGPAEVCTPAAAPSEPQIRAERTLPPPPKRGWFSRR